MSKLDWDYSPNEDLVDLVDEIRSICMNVYSSDKKRVQEDARRETSISEGGYGRKQVQELLQNSADALKKKPGKIEVRLTRNTLYVANQGTPFDQEGIEGLLYSHFSSKAGDEIGRFGLGFKSISGISDSPQIISRSVSFTFNRNHTHQVISDGLGYELRKEEVPALRLAWPLNPIDAFAEDEVLRSLAQWAVTIVKVPLKENSYAQLVDEILEFDESFCLFVPHVKSLRLRIDEEGFDREIISKKTGQEVTLTNEDGRATRWLVLSEEHRPSTKALASAGTSARRESVQVSWAVPLSGKASIGHLAAYFPVKSEITLSGIINAPWKLSEDRIDVIQGDFNLEILTEVVPRLVVNARHHLIKEVSPGRYLDILPARGREARSWADGKINEPIYNALRESRSLPNINLELRSPNSLSLLPFFSSKEYSFELLEDWAEKVIKKDEWVHPECTWSTERRAKTVRIMGLEPEKSDDRYGVQLFKWLEAVVDPASTNPEQSIEAIALATALFQSDSLTNEEQIKKADIVLLESGGWTQIVTGRCFLGAGTEISSPALIDQRVTDHPEARKALVMLGITEYSDSGELFSVLREVRTNPEVNWDKVWMTLRSSSMDRVDEGFREILDNKQQKVIKVVNGKGRWSTPEGLYSPGFALTSRDADANYLVNKKYHASDMKILERLSIFDRPTILPQHTQAKWYREYLEHHEKQVGQKLSLPQYQWSKLDFNVVALRGPLDLLPSLTPENKASLTKYLLSVELEPYIRVGHRNTKKESRVLHPIYWWLKKHGMLKTALGIVPLDQCFVVDENDPEQIRGLVPSVVDLEIHEDAAAALGMHFSITEYSSSGFSKLAAVHREADDEVSLGKVYSWWAYTHPSKAPDKMHVKTADGWHYVSPKQICVTADPSREEVFEQLGFPTITVPTVEDLNFLAEWDVKNASNIPLRYEPEISGEPEELVVKFPPLQHYEDSIEEIEDLLLQPVSSVDLVTQIPGESQARSEVDSGRSGNVIFTSGTTEAEQLTQVMKTLELPCDQEIIEGILAQIEKSKNTRLHREIRSATSNAERLLLTVGEERLRPLIHESAIKFLEHTGNALPKGLALAELCIKMFGTSALEMACRQASDSLPVDSPPAKWNGSYSARKWVRELNFPDEWAGHKFGTLKSPVEYINGPAQAGEFHPYQAEVSERLRQMIIGDGLKRGLITLPTGAGKTRVTVQTIIEVIARGELDTADGEPFSGPILWIVDGEELGEQAIEAWSFLWRGFGRTDTSLALSRHYAGYVAEEETVGVQVVIASFQKLVKNVDAPNFAWLKNTPFVIIDEAHRSTAKSYTKILEWTGRTRTQRDKLLLGLSATPFRGRADSEDTHRLHRRYDENFLDEGVFGEESPMVRLQNDNVLAHVTMGIIRPEGEVSLSHKEIEDFKENNWLSKSKEREIGDDLNRTQKIIDSIKSKPSDWPILVFAASVENAQALAALLSMDGIPATAITEKTSPSERKLAIQRFKDKELRVITNYAVLSQGFDAPQTRAVYITRPTTSEVRYQQMIGRGLRGPKNGGTQEVHIVNVLDNLESFDLSINYKPFEELAEWVAEE